MQHGKRLTIATIVSALALGAAVPTASSAASKKCAQAQAAYAKAKRGGNPAAIRSAKIRMQRACRH